MNLQDIAERYDVEALNAGTDSIVAVGEDGRIGWANLAWFQFGRENGALPESIEIGNDYFGAMEPAVRAHMQGLVAASRATRKPFQFDYECSSGTEYRAFRVEGLPLQRNGTLFVHSLRVVHPHDRQGSEPLLGRYVGNEGLLTMCAHCRRVRRLDKVSWDWVPTWVDRAPTAVTHGLCMTCAGFHWGLLSPMRVLVVDDDAMIREVIGSILSNRRYEVVLSESLGDARQHLLQEPFDALLCDLGMPDGSGLELVRWAQRRLPTLRCAIVSGRNKPADLASDIAWIGKPFTEEDILRPLPRMD